jgi:hypothetical protein
MGKTMTFVFTVLALLVSLYVVMFIAYFIDFVEGMLGVAVYPYQGIILSIKGFGPIVFMLLLPLSVVCGFAGFVFFSERRWKGKTNRLRQRKIDHPRVCVVLTAYDDQEAIGTAVQDFLAQEMVSRVIVVDNNSNDQTSAAATTAGGFVVRESKQGYGYACIRGLTESLVQSDADIVVLCEGDGTFSAEDLRKIVPYLENVDLVVGTRTTQELLDVNSQLDWFYVWGNLFLAKMIQVKFWDVKHWGRVRLTDVGCTLRAIHRDALQRISPQLIVGGNHFSPHMIMVAIANGLKVIEVPITFRKRIGQSKGAGASKRKAIVIGLQMMWHILTF